MKILIVGGGGREHALAWKCAQSPRVAHVFVAPGNAGTAQEPKVSNVAIAADEIDALLAFAEREDVALTIVGPEGPLVAGIADRFAAARRRCFGPSRAAARLEGSKAFTKDFLERYRIPTASHATFTAADFDAGYVRAQRLPLVVKADGLAAGKGVVICETHESALATAQRMLGGGFGAAGSTIVIEEYLSGEEVSFIVVAHDDQVVPLATSQDHKRRDAGDAGPNTGGMGAYSPAPIVTPALHERIMSEVIRPTLRGLRSDGNPYTGFLYAGLMIAADGTPKVLEFNCRFGDPETQPVLMRLESDLVDLCEAAIDGELHRIETRWDSRAALGVVMAAGGYPDAYRQGDAIDGLDAAALLPGKVFHAGTRLAGARVVTAGGRVLCAVGLGDTVRDAQRQAYALVDAIHWNRAQYRRDIGYRAMAREQTTIGPGSVLPDAVSADAVSPKAISRDAVSADAVSADAISRDAVSADAVSANAVSADAISRDAVSADAVSADAISRDAVSADAVSADAVSADAVSPNAISRDAVSPDT